MQPTVGRASLLRRFTPSLPDPTRRSSSCSGSELLAPSHQPIANVLECADGVPSMVMPCRPPWSGAALT